jgi:hypothetical protein
VRSRRSWSVQSWRNWSNDPSRVQLRGLSVSVGPGVRSPDSPSLNGQRSNPSSQDSSTVAPTMHTHSRRKTCLRWLAVCSRADRGMSERFDWGGRGRRIYYSCGGCGRLRLHAVDATAG